MGLGLLQAAGCVRTRVRVCVCVYVCVCSQVVPAATVTSLHDVVMWL